MTKLMNRLQSMFPEAAHIEATYREPAETSFGSGTVTWAPQVFVDGQWSSNALVFATKAEAIHYARDLFARWALCTDFRAVESPLPANYSYHDCNLKELT
jgi:hypothetical protein